MSKTPTEDRVLLAVVGIIGVFIVLSIVAQFLLVWTGRFGADDAGVFRPIFDLVTVLVGGIGGYLTGIQVERKKGSDE